MPSSRSLAPVACRWVAFACVLALAACLGACGERAADDAAAPAEVDPAVDAPSIDALTQENPSLAERVTRQTQCEYVCESDHELCAFGAAAVAAPSAAREPGQVLPDCAPFCDAAPAESAAGRGLATCDERRDTCLQQCAEAAAQ